MGELLDEAMEQGAFGLSTGLVYPPAHTPRPTSSSALASA